MPPVPANDAVRGDDGLPCTAAVVAVVEAAPTELREVRARIEALGDVTCGPASGRRLPVVIERPSAASTEAAWRDLERVDGVAHVEIVMVDFPEPAAHGTSAAPTAPLEPAGAPDATSSAGAPDATSSAGAPDATAPAGAPAARAPGDARAPRPSAPLPGTPE